MCSNIPFSKFRLLTLIEIGILSKDNFKKYVMGNTSWEVFNRMYCSEKTANLEDEMLIVADEIVKE